MPEIDDVIVYEAPWMKATPPRPSPAHDFAMIDCQMRTEHLVSLGGREIPRADFLARLRQLTRGQAQPGPWSAEGLDTNW